MRILKSLALGVGVPTLVITPSQLPLLAQTPPCSPGMGDSAVLGENYGLHRFYRPSYVSGRTERVRDWAHECEFGLRGIEDAGVPLFVMLDGDEPQFACTVYSPDNTLANSASVCVPFGWNHETESRTNTVMDRRILSPQYYSNVRDEIF